MYCICRQIRLYKQTNLKIFNLSLLTSHTVRPHLHAALKCDYPYGIIIPLLYNLF